MTPSERAHLLFKGTKTVTFTDWESLSVWFEAAQRNGYIDGVKTAANIVKSHNVIHGDHYAAYEAPSADAPELVQAIERLLTSN
jgi:hypothetical protein